MDVNAAVTAMCLDQVSDYRESSWCIIVQQLNQIFVILVIINACYPKPPLDVL